MGLICCFENNYYNGDKISQFKNCIIIMDLDGTLIDSDKVNFQLLFELLKKYEFDHKMETIMIDLAEGIHFNDIMHKIEMPLDIRQKMDSEMKILLRNQNYHLLPGVFENLENLKKDGFELSIVTDNYIEITQKFLQQNLIFNFFNKDLLFCSNNFNYLKPSKEIISEVLKRSGRDLAVLIGNSSKDLEFAKRSNLPIVIINNFSSLNLNNPVGIYYQRIRQITDGEKYEKIYKSQTWDDIPEIIKKIL